MTKVPEPYTVFARFGAELRGWRTGRGYSQQGLARRVWRSQELLAKIEKAERWPSRELAVRCDAVLDTGGVLAALWEAVEIEHRASMRCRWPHRAGREALLVARAGGPAGSR